MPSTDTVFQPEIKVGPDGRRTLTYTATQDDVTSADALRISDIPTPCVLELVELERTTADVSTEVQPEIGAGPSDTIGTGWSVGTLSEVAVADVATSYARISADVDGNPHKIPRYARPVDLVCRNGLDAHADLITWRITIREE